MPKNVVAGLLFFFGMTTTSSAEILSTPASVEVRKLQGHYRLEVNGLPFALRGAGLENGDLAQLAQRGGTAFRTWSTHNGRQLLDSAQSHGLKVVMGLEITAERHGFDYNDEKAVAAQIDRIEAEVLALKSHPALLMWVIGNELNLGATNPKVWDSVNRIAERIHRIDSKHPVMTAIAGLDATVVAAIQTRAPAVDILGIQLYADIAHLPAMLARSGWAGPYIISEWGPTGHWQVPLTAWGAPIEDSSAEKAAHMQDRYRHYVALDNGQYLGDFVFLWGQKQERTPTWYSLFLPSGEPTAAVDTLQFLWQGQWPENRSPLVSAVHLDGKQAYNNIIVSSGTAYSASVQMDDPDADPLQVQWTIMRESAAQSSGGDAETIPETVWQWTSPLGVSCVTLPAPKDHGAYRLFVTVRDNHGNAGHANIPFAVKP